MIGVSLATKTLCTAGLTKVRKTVLFELTVRTIRVADCLVNVLIVHYVVVRVRVSCVGSTSPTIGKFALEASGASLSTFLACVLVIRGFSVKAIWAGLDASISI